jgi:membrane protein YqaA with SNARE-associated domain
MLILPEARWGVKRARPLRVIASHAIVLLLMQNEKPDYHVPDAAGMAAQPPPSPAERRRKLIRFLAVTLLAMLANVFILIFASAFDLRQLGVYGYLGVFAIALLGNATVLFPVPYPAAVAVAATTLSLPGVALAAAVGSVIGETLAFVVGRSGKAVVERSRVYEWMQRQLRHPVRAALIIFVLAAIPNPLFDVAGLTAGAMGLPYALFVIPTLLGRIVKMLFFGLAGQELL